MGSDGLRPGAGPNSVNMGDCPDIVVDDDASADSSSAAMETTSSTRPMATSVRSSAVTASTSPSWTRASPSEGCESVFRFDGPSPIGNLILGTSNSETITGTSGSDRVSAKQDDDTVKAGGGVDFLFLGDGKGTVNGEGGPDPTVDGDDDADLVSGGPGPDRLFSVTGTADTIDCGAADGATDVVLADSMDVLFNCESDFVVLG